jgi:hypothetical protein
LQILLPLAGEGGQPKAIVPRIVFAEKCSIRPASNFRAFDASRFDP